MRFTKMHGAGNDYVYVDAFDQPIPGDLPQLAVAVSNRHTGIGADGLIVVAPSKTADARMIMLNADGSVGEMCGNGVRCLAKYVYDRGIAGRNPLTIETARGVLQVELVTSKREVVGARVNMGVPIFDASSIPTTLPGDPPIDAPLAIPGGGRDGLPREIRVTCLSMGNPHCVAFVDELSDTLVLGVGPRLERHPAFPNRVNVEFVQVLSPCEIRMRVWERGAGETQACGSGACAAVVAGVLNGRTDRKVTAHLLGGDLDLEWSESGEVFQAGPAVEVFTGHWPAGVEASGQPILAHSPTLGTVRRKPAV